MHADVVKVGKNYPFRAFLYSFFSGPSRVLMSVRAESGTKMEGERGKEMMTRRGQGGLEKESRGEIKHEAKVMCGPQRGVEGGGGTGGGLVGRGGWRARGLTDGHIQTVCLQNYSTVKIPRAFRQQTLLNHIIFGPSV